MTALTLTAREFRTLVEPVLPMAGRDGMLPILTTVLVETDGMWLSAMTTDRFRVGIKRIEKRATEDDPATEWPEFRALIPTRAVRAMLTTFKPKRGTMDPTLTLTVDDNKMTTEAVGLFDLFDSGRFTHYLEDGEYPDLRAVVRKAMDVPDGERQSTIGVNPAFMADFKACGSTTMRLVVGGAKSPVVVTDDDGFLGLLMAPKAEKPEPKKRAPRKPKSVAS